VTKAIFWDNDGVLVDTERLYFLATQRTLAAAGIPLTREQYVELFLVQGRGAWHLAAEAGHPPSEVERLREERNRLYGSYLDEGDLVIDGVRDVLEALHGSYAMAVVTSSRRDHFAAIHRRTGLLEYFQFALTEGDYARNKPHPDPYLLAVERSGFRKEECLVVEDSARGLIAAREAGVRCIVVPSDLTRGSDFTGAYRVLGRIGELIGALE
jgi:HAD superfamily hydrolase (TIGR01509 family)